MPLERNSLASSAVKPASSRRNAVDLEEAAARALADHRVGAEHEGVHEAEQQPAVGQQVDVGDAEARVHAERRSVGVAASSSASAARKPAEQPVERALEHGEEQRLLGAEHPHHVGLADAGGLGDRIRRRADVAALAEHRGGRLEDQLAALRRLHPGGGLSAVLGCCVVMLDMLSIDN